MLLSTAFFPPVSWFAAACQADTVSLEACENYCKQSYRNRCLIASASGVEAISVPVVHRRDIFHTKITDIEIDYSVAWVKKAWKAIESAYGTSAFFEFYKDDVYAILSSGQTRLWDLNLALIEFFINKIGVDVEFIPTLEFTAPSEDDPQDLRYSIHPKKPNGVLRSLDLEKPYFQVFAGKYGFISDLSVMDLLFNEGPDSLLSVVPFSRISSRR